MSDHIETLQSLIDCAKLAVNFNGFQASDDNEVVVLRTVLKDAEVAIRALAVRDPAPPTSGDSLGDVIREMSAEFLATHPTPADESGAEEDAARWRALIGSARVRVIGIAGPWNGYAHIGLELWTKHDGGHEPPCAVEWLTRYADAARRARGEG